MSPTSQRPIISHPYPPSYRPAASPSPPRQSARLRSDSDGPELKRQSSGVGYGYGEAVHPVKTMTEDEEKEAELERQMLEKGMVDWKAMRRWRFWVRKEWIVWYIAAVVMIVVVCLVSLYHDEIIHWLKPAADWMQRLPAGWTIPIGILFVISFPPLGGHEIVAILCGVVWGLWEGFGIVCAGTFLGEIGNFYFFRYLCKARADKIEKENLNYACLAHVVREGGLLVVLVARLSAIPGHFTTAVFSTCGFNIWTFSLGAALSLPKQLITVYLGVVLFDTSADEKSKIISKVVLGVSFLITVLAAWWIWWKMDKARIHVWRAHRAALAAKGGDVSDLPANPEIELNIRRASYKEFPEGGDLDDDSSPILAKVPVRQARGSYQSPYDIRYVATDDMSIYDVDGGKRASSHPYGNSSHSNLILESEQDLGATRHDYDNLQPYGTAASRSTLNTSSFPEAQPYEHPGLVREPSLAYSIQGQSPVEPASFPQPLPTAQADLDDLVNEPLTPVTQAPRRGVQLVDSGYVSK